MTPTLREQIKAIVREVLLEELDIGTRQQPARQEPARREFKPARPKGRVTDPDKDRRLKQNRYRDPDEDIDDRHYSPTHQV